MHAQRLQVRHTSWIEVVRRSWLIAGFALLAASFVACAGSDSDAPAESMSEPGMATSDGALAPSMSGDGVAGAGAGADRDSGGFGGEMGAVAQEEAASQSSGANTQPIADVLGRQVIRNGSVDLTVESVESAFDEIRGLVDEAGGYLSGSSFSGHEESQRARMTVRIPAERFDQVIADLRALAIEVDSVSTSSQDVTEEYTDLEASLRNLQAVEQQYLTLLGETNDIGEILQVQDRLNSVRYELERVQGRLNLLDNQTSLATLEVTLYPESSSLVETPSTGFVAQVQDAWESSLDFMAGAGTGIVVALVWSWWLIPFAVIATALFRRYAGRLVPARAAKPAPERVDTPEGAA